MSILPTQEEARFVAKPIILLSGSTLVFLAHLLFLGQLALEFDSNIYAWFKRDSLSDLNNLVHFSILLSSYAFFSITGIIIQRRYKQWNSAWIVFGYIIALALFTLLTNVGPFTRPDPGYTISDLDFSEVNIIHIEVKVNKPIILSNPTTSSKTITNPTTIKAVKDFLKNKEKGWQMFCPNNCPSGGIEVELYYGKDYARRFQVKDNYISVQKSDMVGTPLDYSKILSLDEVAKLKKMLGI